MTWRDLDASNLGRLTLSAAVQSLDGGNRRALSLGRFGCPRPSLRALAERLDGSVAKFTAHLQRSASPDLSGEAAGSTLGEWSAVPLSVCAHPRPTFRHPLPLAETLRRVRHDTGPRSGTTLDKTGRPDSGRLRSGSHRFAGRVLSHNSHIARVYTFGHLTIGALDNRMRGLQASEETSLSSTLTARCLENGPLSRDRLFPGMLVSLLPSTDLFPCEIYEIIASSAFFVVLQPLAKRRDGSPNAPISVSADRDIFLVRRTLRN